MRIQTRIIILVVGVTLGMSLLIFKSEDILLRDHLTANQNEWVRTLVHSLAESVAQSTIDGEKLKTRQLFQRIVSNDKALEYIYVTDFEGQIFTHSFDNGFPKALAKDILDDTQTKRHSHWQGEDEIFSVIAPLIDGMDAQLHIGINQREINSIIAVAQGDLWKIFGIVSISGLIIALLLGVRMSRPLKILSEEISRYGDKGGAVAVNIDTSDPDIRELAKSFQEMAASRSQTESELLASQQNLHLALERAEQSNEAKTFFLANMSHELRTPLNAIMGFSDVMKSQPYGPLGSKKYIEYVEDIYSSGSHLLSLISDILHMSKIEAGSYSFRIEPFNVAEFMEDCLTLVKEQARKSDVHLTNNIADDLPPLMADYRAIKQCVVNLLSNAIKFTPRTGTVSISASVSSQRFSLIVADTGIGVAEKDIHKLTDPFTQVERMQTGKVQEGTGIGLTITRNLVEMHGGSLEFESEIDVGTTVTINLPRGQATEKEDGVA